MLEIMEISKKFVNSPAPVLDRVSLEVREGECLSLLGPSGCGKTTLLRLIAGFETADSGQLKLDGKNLSGVGPAGRPFHMVFQKHALFPHLTVFENIAFGLKIRGLRGSELRARVEEGLALVRLQGFESRSPATLSGGQSQRVALARALVNRPRVLLLDEPFSALDLKLREGMATEMRELQRKLGLTLVFVTHDQGEAFAMSDRVALMNRGRFEQVSSPRDLYVHPATLFAADFVGSVSKIPVEKILSIRGESVEFSFAGSILKGRAPAAGAVPGAAVALVRPECFRWAEAATGGNRMPARIRDWTFRGARVVVRLVHAAGPEFHMSLDPSSLDGDDLREGREVVLCFREEETLIRARDESGTPT